MKTTTTATNTTPVPVNTNQHAESAEWLSKGQLLDTNGWLYCTWPNCTNGWLWLGV